MAALDVLSSEIKNQLVFEITELVQKEVAPRLIAEQEGSNRYLNAKESAKYLHISYDTFKKVRNRGLIKGFILEGTSVRLYRKSELERYVRESEEKL